MTIDQEILKLRSNNNQTLRPCSNELEDILYTPHRVLDHGFIRVIDYMGDDNAIVQAARVSYGAGTKKVNQDKALINYLMRHQHTTPFEMCDIKFHIKLPIFVARQWIRHRTASINEYSARYSILGKEFYIPNKEQLAKQSSINKQGRGEVLDDKEANVVLDMLINDSQNCYNHYEYMLNEDQQGNIIDPNRSGLTRELARMNLTLNYYTEWYWKVNLHNLLHFVRLRADSHAQYEIRVYADVILKIIEKWVPFTYEAFINYRFNGKHLSGRAIQIIKDMLNGKKIDQESSGLSQREWSEFCQIFDMQE